LTITFREKIVVPKHVLIRQIEEESVLLNLENERYFGLDSVGTRMWAVLTASDSVQVAFETLLAEYDVAAEQLRENLQTLLGELQTNGLIEVREG
jgi:hypothetical protein